jgi:hypothetical protein
MPDEQPVINIAFILSSFVAAFGPEFYGVEQFLVFASC